MPDATTVPELPSMRTALAEPDHVHVRLADQTLAPDDQQRAALASALPDLVPFPGTTYHRIFTLFDWDHRLPSQLLVLRVLCVQDAEEARRVERALADRIEAIDADDLYPEFDVPDFDGIEASETYIGILSLPDLSVEDFRLTGRRRVNVDEALGRKLGRFLEGTERFRAVERARAHRRQLGGAMVAGWAPPFASEHDRWTLEFWLLTEFDGQTGRAHVFCLDPNEPAIVAERAVRVQVG